MRSSFFRSITATVLILTSPLSWSAPAWAAPLRGVSERRRGFQRHADRLCPQLFRRRDGNGDQREPPRFQGFLGFSLPAGSDNVDHSPVNEAAYQLSFVLNEEASGKNLGNSGRQVFSIFEGLQKRLYAAASKDAPLKFVSLNTLFHGLPLCGPKIGLGRINSGPSFEEESEISRFPP